MLLSIVFAFLQASLRADFFYTRSGGHPPRRRKGMVEGWLVGEPPSVPVAQVARSEKINP